MSAIVLFQQILSLFDMVAGAVISNPLFSTLLYILLIGVGLAVFMYLKAVVAR